MQRSADTSSSFHQPRMKSRAYVEPSSGKHSVFTHFPKDPNREKCVKRPKKASASCRRRAGTVVPRVEHFLVTWSQRITKFSVKRVNRGTIIDMSWWYKIESCLCKTKTTHETPEEPGASKETRSHLHRQFLGIWQVLRGIILESLYVNATQIGNKWICRKSSAQSERGDICGIVNLAWMKWAGGFCGMLVLSAKRSRPLVWWEERHHTKGGSKRHLTDE